MSISAKAIANTVFIVGLGLAAQSCTTRKSILPEPAYPVAPAKPVVTPNPVQGGTVTMPGELSSSSIPLDEAALKANYGLDTTKLSYHFNYIDTDRSEPITFVAGKAVLEFHNLAQGKAGDLTLEILQTGVVRVRGVIKALTLKPGKNEVTLQLAAVGPNSGATGDLSIDVKIDSGGSGGNGAATGTGSGGAASGSATGSGAASGSATGTGSGGPATGSGAASGSASSTQPADPNAYSYAREIKPLMDQYCSECHHAGKSLDLSSAPSAAAKIDKVIDAAAGGTMPPAPRDKMPADAVEKIRKWKAHGLVP